ncbi:hypothetical protein Acsp05_09530 [Actinokineospora sp. NBRC 105648]|nr:hypothetical protein Acsp05_09530 [Actinokineospora sp. NBRC 105648]
MVAVLVTVAASADLGRVVAELRGAGLVVERVLGEVGVVVGSVERGGVAALRGVSGVDGVEFGSGVGVPGPGSDVQ